MDNRAAHAVLWAQHAMLAVRGSVHAVMMSGQHKNGPCMHLASAVGGADAGAGDVERVADGQEVATVRQRDLLPHAPACCQQPHYPAHAYMRSLTAAHATCPRMHSLAVSRPSTWRTALAPSPYTLDRSDACLGDATASRPARMHAGKEGDPSTQSGMHARWLVERRCAGLLACTQASRPADQEQPGTTQVFTQTGLTLTPLSHTPA